MIDSLTTLIIGWGWFSMAQRGMRAGRKRRAARRYGFTGARTTLMALLALACAGAVAGMLWRGGQGGVVIERSAMEGEAPSDASPEGREPHAEEQKAQEEDEARRCFVHVDGAVGQPGVVELEGSDLRVYDAVKAAGGLLDEADTTSVNLAEPLVDGAKIHIPAKGEESAQVEAPPSGQAMTSGATGAGPATVLVNINTATAEELQSLSGVGEATAAAIIGDREQNGPFAAPEDLMRVSGIGEKKYARVKDHICV